MLKILFKILLFFLLFFPQIIFAQYQDLKFKNLTWETGLPDYLTNGILLDREGFIWIGTRSSGIYRYDGYNFKNYSNVTGKKSTLNYSWINIIFEDRNGIIWIGTNDEGLSRFEKITEQFINFMHNSADSNSLSGNTVHSVFLDRDGILWIGCESEGLNKYDEKNNRFTHYRNNINDTNSLIGNTVRAIYEDRSGNLWIGMDKGLDRFDRKKEIFYHYRNIANNLLSIDNNNIIQCIYEDKDGTLWIGTANGLNKLINPDEKNYKFKKYFFSNDKNKNNISSIYCEANGLLWIGTYDEGLYIFNPVTEQFTNSRNINSDAGSLVYDQIPNNSIIEDRSGNIWIGTSNGISIHRKIKFNCYHYNEALYALTFFEDKSGNVWITGNNNFHIRDTNGIFKIISYKMPDILPSQAGGMYEGICDKTGVIWLGYRSGLYKFDKESGKLNHFYTFLDENNLPSLEVHVLFEDSDSLLWVGTSNGLWVFNKERTNPGKFIHNDNDSFSIGSNNIYIHFYEDTKGSIWITLWRNGVDKYDKKTGKFHHYQNNPSDSNSISTNTVAALYDDGKGNIWIATSAGLDKLNPETNTFTHFTNKDGLTDICTMSILPDNSGNLWICTNTGISKFNPVTQKFINYNKDDGLQKSQFSDMALKTSKGEMFFLGGEGINYFFPDSIKENTYIPPVVISSFKIFDKEASLDKAIIKTDEIKLTYKENFFSFEFSALDYTNPQKNLYAYKLEGVDDDWRHSGNNRIAKYTNIDPGEYMFRVKGSNDQGVWNEEGTSIRIIITPPWWATWRFRTIAVFAIAGIFGGSVRYITIQRYKRRLALEKERARISKDMHDEVGSSLSKISILSEIAKQNISNPEITGKNVEKISQSASEVVDNISEIIWAINPKNDAMDNLLAYIREYAAETLELKNIDYKIVLPDIIPLYNLSAETRRNIFLVIKEALNNIMKYAQASMVNIFIKINEGRLEITLKDNGKGFDAENTRRFGNGLINMKKRMEDIGGEFILNSQLGSGTEIRLSIKLNR